MSYQSEYLLAKNNPTQYWQEQAKLIDWFQAPTNILSQDQDDFYHWYADGSLNTSYLALDYHVKQGRGEQTALIYDSPVTNTKEKYSYAELTVLVAKFADVLAKQGVTKGDRVLIYMPMIPQAAIAMLATARLGAIHSVVFGGFAPHELAVRIDDATPKVVVTASCGVEIEKVIAYKPMIDKAFEDAIHKPDTCIVYQRDLVKADLLPNRDIDWQQAMINATEHEPVPVLGKDPLYILYTSGTTGKPKGVVRENGGHAIAMKYSMDINYGVKPGDVFWAASDVGWVVGHSYIVYGPLISGCATVLYEGKPIKTPDAGAFWRVCEEYNVNVLFSAPTAFRAIRKEDPHGNELSKYNLPSLKRLYLAGERLDPATYHWLNDITHLPVIDHWWQTETGWPIAGIPVGLDTMEPKEGSAGVATPGYQIEILDPDGVPVNKGESGYIAIKLPLPPGCLPTIWNDPERFKVGYLNSFPGYYVTGDGGYIDKDDYLFIMGRTDDVINVAGHRLSTGEMEEVISNHKDVAECAVVGIKCKLKGQVPLALIVLKNGCEQTTEVHKVLKELIRDQIGAIASLKEVLTIDRLPKTRSGKILRKVMRQMIDGEEVQVPSTIDDMSILDELKISFRVLT
ncbi:propionyl-CoA synthetase [Psychrosphaera aquimarina]|uniref:Propionyl-CoA synthetase n=1 Tax=Psychrosphaera aquimarina TaxID=2044854 RepID=A0ABU3QWA9_9GAMM|nr:propionyl-CoA synthetase [Psychrosphaera aquimarina]MDU0111712.1 propionyl-CoA synthetase [Psychrosphaera aquimarina]